MHIYNIYICNIFKVKNHNDNRLNRMIQSSYSSVSDTRKRKIVNITNNILIKKN